VWVHPHVSIPPPKLEWLASGLSYRLGIIRRGCKTLHFVLARCRLSSNDGAHGPETYNKYTRQSAQEGGPVAFLCNFLDDHGVKPGDSDADSDADAYATGSASDSDDSV
jgi:hypothetical protein